MNFDMNTCWARGLDQVRNNFSLLVVIAGIFLLLPTVALYLLVPDMQMLADPGVDQSVLKSKIAEILLPLMGAALLMSLVQFAGQAAMIALMGKGRPTVGEALGVGLKTVPSLVVVLLAFTVAVFIGSLLVTLPISILAGVAGIPALAILAVFPLLLLMFWMMARLSMTMPAMVLGATLNPFKAMGESWRITRRHQWAILLFWGVFYAVFTIISLLFNGIAGVIAALIASGTGAMLVAGLANGIASVVSGMLICALAVAMYGQLSGDTDTSIADTFE